MIIIYRACSKGSPYKGIGDKQDLVKECFTSFKKAFRPLDFDLVVLLDKPTKKLREIFRGENVEETYHEGFDMGNTASFHRQVDIALSSAHKSFLFVEDDYMWLPKAGEKIIGNKLPFFTPYDHPDYYLGGIHDYEREVVVENNWHWQTVSATTLTFGGQTELLRKEEDTIKSYGWADYNMWTDLVRRHKLYAPMPTLAGHIDVKTDMPPMWDMLKTS